MGGRSASPRAAGHRPRTPTARVSRLDGIDMARGAALLAMIATHVLPTLEQSNATQQWAATWVGLVFSGRAAALFAVLAGISLSLGRVPAVRNRLGLALRAAVVAAIGLTVGLVKVDVAVILVQYAVLFWCALPVLALRRQALGLLAAAWILIAPVVAYLVRPVLLDGSVRMQLGHNPVWADVADPARLLADLMVTGYYPVLQWFGYLLVGLWIGQADLTRAATQVWILVGGAAVAVVAKASAWALLIPLGGINALLATGQARLWPLQAMLEANLAGVEQTGTWWWLTTASPHSGTTLDLLHTSGTSAAAIGAFLLVARIGPLARSGILLPLAGAGAMTLTLYTAHVWALSTPFAEAAHLTPESLLAVHIAAALAIGLFVRANGWRGPLEAISHAATRLGLAARKGQDAAARRPARR
ncbi:heparan-alpha-glucosaminide N-acetyltransferase domain-containing protein [Sinomonas sp. P10A9]|uniref:Heparan-alpha-glucosaminide N-acetyltransferase domain-containing protein n=1 Tax=Sinomonas puerhi TaxID=3238584 RepID=A0AB39L748_9MICC